jgi:hypothetical protein
MKRAARIRAFVSLVAAAALVLASACAKKLADLEPFPCAKDGTCPDGLSCVNGLCTTVIGCSNGAGCADGFVCSSPNGQGTCITDCSNGEDCGTGQQCEPLWYGAKKGCVPSDCATNPQGSDCVVAHACASVTQAIPCNLTCHPTGGPTTIGCDDQATNYVAFCQCSDGRAVTLGCGLPTSCEERCREECDVMKQDCANPATPRCEVVRDPTSGIFTSRCTADGTVDEGQPCTQESDGTDDCKHGLTCTVFGGPSPACRRLCNTDNECGSTNVCVHHPNRFAGMCLPPCTVFGSDCQAGLTCRPAQDDQYALRKDGKGYCLPDSLNTVAPNGGCVADDQCEGAAYCFFAGWCKQVCDTSHACTGGSCTLGDAGTALGACTCN